MIDGVRIKPLRQIIDERGKVMHMLRCDDPEFERFGEIYFSVVNPGAIKGWHLHKVMDINYAVVYGAIKLVIYDDRPGSATRGSIEEIFTGPEAYALVHIPHGLWNGMKGLGAVASIVANCSTMPHCPNEIERLDPFSRQIPYEWALRHR